MSKIICRNTGIDQIQRTAFSDIMPGNPLVNCRYIGDIDLSPWGPLGGGCVPVNGGWSSWKQTPCFGNFRISYRLCNSPYPNECGRPCHSSGRPYEIQMEFCGGFWWRERFGPQSEIGPVRALGMEQALATDATASREMMEQVPSEMTSQIESAISKMLTPGQTNIDASVFEKAISSVSGMQSVVGPNVGPAIPANIGIPRTGGIRREPSIGGRLMREMASAAAM